MKNSNTIFPAIDIEKHLVDSLGEILDNSTPVRMFTYDTARAAYNEEFYVSSKTFEEANYTYRVMLEIVSEMYGRDRMDNKITLEFDYAGVIVYVSYADGKISISNKVNFFSSIDGVNSYRVVPYPTGPKVIGKIELPEDSISSDDCCCEHCGCDTDSRWGDSRHVLRVRDEVYGTWSQEMICDSCYYSIIEKDLI